MQIPVTVDIDLETLAWTIARELSVDEIRKFIKTICDHDASIELEEALFVDRHRLLKSEYDHEGVLIDVTKLYLKYPELEEES